MSKIQENIKLIVGIKDLEKRLKGLEDKQIIASATSIATQVTPAGTEVGGGTSTPGAGGGFNNPYNGIDSAENVFDDPKLGDELNALTDIYDCATGEELRINTDGTFVTPEGWTDPYNPPIPGSYEDGMYWVMRNGATVLASSLYMEDWGKWTPYLVASHGPLVSGNGGPGSIYGPNFFDDYIIINRVGRWEPSNQDYQIIVQHYDIDTSTATGSEFSSFSFTQEDCSVSAGISLGACSITEPPTLEWPTGEPTQLTYKNGRLQTNPNQTDASDKYKDGEQSSVDFCFDDSETSEVRHGTFEPTNNGGFMLYETEGGEPIGKLQAYNANGELAEITEVADIEKFRPKS